MSSLAEMRADFENVILEHGMPITVQYWPIGSIGFNDYNEAQKNTGSAVSYSGGAIIHPINSNDAGYNKQGILGNQNFKMFLHGSLITDPNMLITLGNTGSVYEVVDPNSITSWEVSGTVVYHEIHCRIRTLSDGT